jgi:uncharacterized protein with von Willebrand factor type A (vWA) domain
VRSRYVRWDGSQDPLREVPDVAELLDRLGDDLLMGRAAGRRCEGCAAVGCRAARPRRPPADARRPAPGAAGRARHRRSRSPSSPASSTRSSGSNARRWRERDDEEARFDELRLDALPPDPAGRFRELSRTTSARRTRPQRFADLADRLRKDLLDAHLQVADGGARGGHPRGRGPDRGDAGGPQPAAGGAGGQRWRPPADEPERFAAFKAAHGELLPGDPADLDELLAEMARRAQAAQRFLRSLSPQQRAQLQDLAQPGLRRPRPRVPARPARREPGGAPSPAVRRPAGAGGRGRGRRGRRANRTCRRRAVRVAR